MPRYNLRRKSWCYFHWYWASVDCTANDALSLSLLTCALGHSRPWYRCQHLDRVFGQQVQCFKKKKKTPQTGGVFLYCNKRERGTFFCVYKFIPVTWKPSCKNFHKPISNHPWTSTWFLNIEIDQTKMKTELFRMILSHASLYMSSSLFSAV